MRGRDGVAESHQHGVLFSTYHTLARPERMCEIIEVSTSFAGSHS